jgi:hypothetical protein
VRKYLVLISVILLVATISKSACAESIERANQKDIEMLLSAASGMNSAFWASFIGETRGRVYIEYETAVHAGSLFSKEMKRVVYWLPRSAITNEQLAQFKAYKNKYEPAQ